MGKFLKTTAFIIAGIFGAILATVAWVEHPQIMAATLVLCVSIGGVLFWLGMREIRIAEENRQRHNEMITAIQLGQPTWGQK
jgi:protein-S-isoprenylcysteine O-methyltransferase Ste14